MVCENIYAYARIRNTPRIYLSYLFNLLATMIMLSKIKKCFKTACCQDSFLCSGRWKVDVEEDDHDRRGEKGKLAKASWCCLDLWFVKLQANLERSTPRVISYSRHRPNTFVGGDILIYAVVVGREKGPCSLIF